MRIVGWRLVRLAGRVSSAKIGQVENCTVNDSPNTMDNSSILYGPCRQVAAIQSLQRVGLIRALQLSSPVYR